MAVQNKVDSKKAIEEWRNKQTTTTGTKSDKTAAKKGSTNKTTTPKVTKTIVADVAKAAEDLEKKERVDSGIVEDGNPVPEEQEALEIAEPEEKVVAVESPPATTVDQETTELVINNNNNLINGAVELDQATPSPPVSLPKPSAPPVDEKQELINAIDEEADRRKKEVKKVTRKSSSDNLLKDQPSLEAATTTTTTRTDSKLNSVANNKKESQRKNAATKVETNPSVTSTKAETEKRPPPVTRPRTSLRPPSVRPASARPGAPRKRDRNVEVVIQPEENVQLGDINVKVEQFKASKSLDDDDEENLIVIENINIQDTLLAVEARPEVGTVDGRNQGQLVNQILESQKEFENGDAPKNDALSSRSSGNVAELRDQIQKLTKSIQPLGKFMDFLLEDIDSMQREHEMWRERGKEVSLKLAREKNSTQNTVQSMKHQLDEVNYELEEKRNAIFNVRENILQNEERILKLFKNI